MTELVSVRTLRQHFGDGGNHSEGDVYETTAQHARQLGKLVELVGQPASGEPKAAPAPDNKSMPAPPNKAAPQPANKSHRQKTDA